MPDVIRVFISYAHEDYGTAKRLYDDLNEQPCVKPWLDEEDLIPGEKRKPAITKAIKESSYFIALMSSKSFGKKGFTQKEVRIALDVLEEIPEGDIFVIPIRIDDCNIPDSLKEYHCVNLFPSYETRLKTILERSLGIKVSGRLSRPEQEKKNQGLRDPNGKMHSSENIIKLGLIGVGQSTIAQLSAVKKVSDMGFYYFSDKNQTIRNELNHKGFGAIGFNTDYRELLRIGDINAVVVATELMNHYKHAKDVLNANKDLLLEKPATLHLNQLKELIQIANDKKLCFVCSLHAAFDKTIDWALNEDNIDFIRNEYGWSNKIIKIECEFYDPYMFENIVHKGRFYSLHDSWLDSGVNALSVVNRFVNSDKIFLIKSFFKTCSDPFYRDRIIDAKVEYSYDPDGKIIIYTSWAKNINKKVTVLHNNENMEMILDHTAQKISLKKGNNLYDIIEFEQDRLVSQYARLYEDFSSHLKNRTNNLNHALKIHELLFKAVR